MQTIKTKTKGLGKNNWEKYLLSQHKTELKNLLTDWGIGHKQVTAIFALYNDKVDKTNIQSFYTHPIHLFLNHLLDDNLEAIKTYTSSRNLVKEKGEFIKQHQQEFNNFKVKYSSQGTHEELVTDFYLLKRGFQTRIVKL